ncbi:MAG: ThiF family adenylyltransferase [Lachnospiraceae bacterium]|nr:ThiF family adenylyltransferase [Lachnospiraceae bacterium]
MLNQFSRTQLLLGQEVMERLYNKRIAVFGIGGVGGYVCEALVRSGIGAFDLIDDDKVCLTNCICPPGAQHKCTERRDIPGSTAFVPAVAGFLIAGEIINDLSIESVGKGR